MLEDTPSDELQKELSLEHQKQFLVTRQRNLYISQDCDKNLGHPKLYSFNIFHGKHRRKHARNIGLPHGDLQLSSACS